MTRTGDREIRSVSGRLPDNPGELACMQVMLKLARRARGHFVTLIESLVHLIRVKPGHISQISAPALERVDT